VLTVPERGEHGKDTEVSYTGVQGSGGLGGVEGALKGDKTVNELAALHGVHPTMIHAWKKQLLSHAEELFASGVSKTSTAEHEALQAQLYEQIGRLKTELDWLKKKAASFG
jgi:putative transposase